MALLVSQSGTLSGIKMQGRENEKKRSSEPSTEIPPREKPVKEKDECK